MSNDITNCQPEVSDAWHELQYLSKKASAKSIASLFDDDSSRAKSFSISSENMLVDFSKTTLTNDVRRQLLALAKHCQLETKREAMFAGEKINVTEERAVLHIALRDLSGQFKAAYGEEIAGQVATELKKIESLSEKIRSGEWLGHNGKRIRHVVHIGIGGSDLGPKMVCDALREHQSDDLKVHFVSNVDETHLANVLKGLSPDETLFSISSKTFTTQETMYNANAARDWFLDHVPDESAIASHFVAVSTNTKTATEFGIAEENLLTFWDWVGGRYSLWSSIGFPIAVALGFGVFRELLEGAHEMDRHFYSAELSDNMPVMLALVGIWHRNFMKHDSLAVIPYNDALSLLPMYLQQLDMESNGKSVDIDGRTVSYDTGPIVWGQNGSNGQHAFFQLLHQGTSIVPLEFVVALNPSAGEDKAEQHRVLLSNLLAQSSALMTGAKAEPGRLFTEYDGSKPSALIALSELSPSNLGALIALYEHKVFVQGAVWNINSFDQWGVQLGKKMANAIGTDFTESASEFDASTQANMAGMESHLKAGS